MPPQRKKQKTAHKTEDCDHDDTVQYELRPNSKAQAKDSTRTASLEAPLSKIVKLRVTFKQNEDKLPEGFEFTTEEAAENYMGYVFQKLWRARNVIAIEHQLGLDPDRPGLHKEPISVALNQGPFMINQSDQQIMRSLLELTRKLEAPRMEGYEPDSVMEETMMDYWFFWSELRKSVALKLPGTGVQGEDNTTLADGLVARVFKKLVTAGDEDEQIG